MQLGNPATEQQLPRVLHAMSYSFGAAGEIPRTVIDQLRDLLNFMLVFWDGMAKDAKVRIYRVQIMHDSVFML
jgi:hypothetical protein